MARLARWNRVRDLNLQYKCYVLTIVTQISSSNESVRKLAKDAVDFINAFLQPISQSTPHIYVSALPFTPNNSAIQQQYTGEFCGTLSIPFGKANSWPCIQDVIEEHTRYVKSIAFSPDGKLIASGS